MRYLNALVTVAKHPNRKLIEFCSIKNKLLHILSHFFLAVNPAPALNLKNTISPSSTT